MSAREVREIGHVEGGEGESLHVGVDDGSVAIYVGAWVSADGVTFTAEQAEQFAALFVRACWEASAQGGAA